MNVAGYAASILIGISLGLIGGGGSILTVPALVYLFGIDAVFATTYSLFIVGVTSSVGTLSYFKGKLVDTRIALCFGIPSVAAVFLARNYLIPAIPQQILSIGSYTITKSTLLMLLFAALMIAAAYSMLSKNAGTAEGKGIKKVSYPLMLLQGSLVGTVTGLIGAGGGFLIIPALINFLKMPMKKAIGTSLMIIAINSLMGFSFSLSRTTVQWPLLLSVSAIAVVGILLGSYIATKIDGKRLKPAFGWFVLIMGIYIITKETLLK